MTGRRAPSSPPSPLAWLLIGAVRVYRVTLSGWLGGRCKYYPSCSAYAEEALRVHGAIRGAALAAWRLLRCNPYSRGGVDHVSGRHSYDVVTGGASSR